MRNASTSTHRRSRTKVRALVTPSPVGVVIVMAPAFSAQSKPGNARPVFDENAGVDGVRHLVHVVDIARVHRRRMVATAFKLNRQGDGFFDVGDPHHRQYRHHHFSDGKRMVSWRFHKQQARLIRDVQADGCGNLARVTTDPVTADGTFTTFIDILQQHRLELFGLSGGQFHRVLTFHQTHQLVSDTIHHNQHFFVGADDVVIKRCAFDDGLCGARQVGGLIHHHRGLPAPAAIRRLLVCLRAASTTASPPVTTSRPIPGYLNNRWAVSISGFATVTSKFSGPPAATTA